jgi:hypothetical protein
MQRPDRPSRALQSASNYQALVELWRVTKAIPPPAALNGLTPSESPLAPGDSPGANPANTEARAFSNWAAAYAAFSNDDSRTLVRALGPPMPPKAPSPQRLEWLRVGQAALEALPATKRDSPVGLFLLARLALENGNAALAEQAALQCARSATDVELRQAAAAILDLISEMRKSATTQPPILK